MKPVYRRSYERYARAFGLTSHGRRKLRREIRRHDTLIRRALKRFKGMKLKPETFEQVKVAICQALREALQ